MRSLWGVIPIYAGILLAFLWIGWYSGTDNYSSDASLYGEELVGICLGGPAFMIATIGIIISIWYELRTRS